MSFVLHIGAHRTGTTLMQEAIVEAGNLGHLDRINTIGPQDIRQLENPYNFNFFLSRDPTSVTESDVKKFEDSKARLSRFLDAHFNDERPTFLSDENLMGSMIVNLRDAGFHKNLPSILDHVRSVLPQQPSKVLLGVREYGTYWNSVYNYMKAAHWVKDRAKLFSVERARKAALDHRGWVEIANDIHEAFPKADLEFWSLEDLPELVSEIMYRYLGVPRNAVDLSSANVNRTDRFGFTELFDQTEMQYLSAKYDRDLEVLAQRFFHVRLPATGQA